jgi:outer membrane receptor protein involved in Fe transport
VENAAGALDPDSIVTRQSTNSSNNNSGGTFQVDYVRPLGDVLSLEAGYKGALTRINNDFYSESLDPTTGSFVPDLDLNNSFVYDEEIHAGYGILGFSKGKVDGQVGLRAEQALTDFNLETTDEQFQNDYFSLFPSASASYSFSQATRVRASYSRRINRPGVWRLNPFPQYEDRQNLRTGNPYLKPEYVNSIELGVNHFTGWGSLSFSPYYRHQTDLIERWLTIDSNGVTTVSWENFESTDSYGMEVVGTFRIADAVRGYGNVSLYQFDLDGSNVETNLANESFGWSARGNASWSVTSWLDLQGNYFYRAPIDISRGEISEMQSLDLATKFSFLADRASLTLQVRDVFNTMKFDLYRDDPTYYIDVSRKWESRRARLSFSWTFGSQEYQQRRRRNRRGEEGSPTGGTPAGVGF